MRLHFFSGFQHTSPVHALLDLQLFHFLVIIGGEVDNGKVPTLPEASLGTAPSGGGTSRCQEVGVTGWLLSLLHQHPEGRAAFPFPAAPAPEYGLPLGLSYARWGFPDALHPPRVRQVLLGSWDHRSRPRRTPLPGAASAPHLPAIHSRFRNLVLGVGEQELTPPPCSQKQKFYLGFECNLLDYKFVQINF